jgi:molybdopterin converting factor small subunit
MNVTVKFFSFKTLVGMSELVLDLPAGATLNDLIGLVARRFPAFSEEVRNATYLINQQAGDPDAMLKDGDQVILLKMLGGG